MSSTLSFSSTDSRRFDQDFTDKYVSISSLCARLDGWMASSLPLGAQQASQDTDQYLARTIAAYSARWLPISTGSLFEAVSSRHQAAAVALWRRARRDMLKVINRPSYRCMLALFLFALTPIPTGISEDEEADGISGQACVHAALQQIQTLRARQRILQFNGSKVSPSRLASTGSQPASIIGTPSFINAESTAYWAALTVRPSPSPCSLTYTPVRHLRIPHTKLPPPPLLRPLRLRSRTSLAPRQDVRPDVPR